jgi:Tfp pilus assembly protein PilV
MTNAWHWFRSVAADDEGFGLVETLVALTILVVGLLAVSGLSLAAARQARISDWRGDMTAAGLLALEEVRLEEFTTLSSRTDTFAIGGRDYSVAITVTDLSTRLKDVRVVVAGAGTLAPDTFVTRVQRPRPLPMPYSP